MRSGVTSLLLILLLLSGAMVWNSLAQTPREQDDVIRVETDLTNLFFTATDKQKRFITTLTEADFRITEDGVPQTVLTFQRETDRPLSLAFLIDVSASEERTLPQEKAAARSFIETVLQSSKDQAAIIAFSGSAFLEQGLTRDVIGIYRALERVEVAAPVYLGPGKPISGIASGPGMLGPPREGTTAIWEAIALTASQVLGPESLQRSTGSNQRRRAMILLTDGFDTSSRLMKKEAIKQALAAEAVIYAIGIGDSKRDGVNKGELNAVAEGTGGRAFFPKKEVDLRAAFTEIEQELRTQYLIAYSSTNKNRDGSYREMQIELTNPQLKKEKLKLRHRPGYYASPVAARSPAQ
jgi:Ca-activated chloride channel family protein